MARRPVKSLETKISKVELMLKHVKKPISDLRNEEAKVYLAKIMEDWFKIKKIVQCIFLLESDHEISHCLQMLFRTINVRAGTCYCLP